MSKQTGIGKGGRGGGRASAKNRAEDACRQLACIRGSLAAVQTRLVILSGEHGSYRLDPKEWNGLYELGCLNWALGIQLAAVESKLLRLTNDIRKAGGLREVEPNPRLNQRLKVPTELLETQIKELRADPAGVRADFEAYKAEMESLPLGFQGVAD